MRRLAITGDRDRPGRRDYTGAFRLEARAWVRDAGEDSGSVVRVVPLDAPRRDQRDAIARAIRDVRPDELGIFAHGLPRRIELGYDIATALGLAEALAEVGCSRVALYACSTASDARAGFAARLRDAMCLAGIARPVVVGHESPGHTTRSPRKRAFLAPSGALGEWLVAPGSPGWREWARRMRDGADPLRWQVLDLAAARYSSPAALVG